MVHLILSTTKGNSSVRPFPHQGYLGLTPVRVDGIVSVRLDEDKKPINAKVLTVSLRAYEARQGRVGGAPHSRLLVDYTQTLWRKPDGEEYAELSELNRSFKITLPKRVAGFSTVNLLDYRTYWRLEVGAYSRATPVPPQLTLSTFLPQQQTPLTPYTIRYVVCPSVKYIAGYRRAVYLPLDEHYLIALGMDRGTLGCLSNSSPGA